VTLMIKVSVTAISTAQATLKEKFSGQRAMLFHYQLSYRPHSVKQNALLKSM